MENESESWLTGSFMLSGMELRACHAHGLTEQACYIWTFLFILHYVWDSF